MKIDRNVRQIAEREAAQCGLSASWGSGGKHPILTLTRAGESRSFSVAGSPRSSDNQRNWIRQDIRRIDRELR